ncbi:unnamed protein product [Dracunculus medinensis]|uniref:DPPIV_N domain-containing protein n=1 Tax=Dracunculus medinensis TaxID=318479 RepID=A0A0N4UQF5_DRAME|nr:unnamed protein product [Dracunculus medinensis]
MLSELDVSIENIIFSPDMKKMVYFERKSGGPHNSSLAMILYDWYNKTAKVVVSTVDFSFGKDGFPGLYDVDFPERCWSTDNGRIIFSSAWSSKKEVICVNTKTASLQKLTNLDAVHGSWIVRDVSFDHILVEFSSPSIPPSFFLAKLPESGAETKIDNLRISELKWIEVEHYQKIILFITRDFQSNGVVKLEKVEQQQYLSDYTKKETRFDVILYLKCMVIFKAKVRDRFEIPNLMHREPELCDELK